MGLGSTGRIHSRTTEKVGTMKSSGMESFALWENSNHDGVVRGIRERTRCLSDMDASALRYQQVRIGHHQSFDGPIVFASENAIGQIIRNVCHVLTSSLAEVCIAYFSQGSPDMLEI